MRNFGEDWLLALSFVVAVWFRWIPFVCAAGFLGALLTRRRMLVVLLSSQVPTLVLGSQSLQDFGRMQSISTYYELLPVALWTTLLGVPLASMSFTLGRLASGRWPG